MLATAFEVSLGLLALLIGAAVGIWPWSRLCPSPWRTCLLRNTAIGLFAAIPLGIGLLILDSSRATPFRRIRQIVRRRLLPFFEGAPWSHLLVISLAAGFGEETLFRGFLQDGFAAGLGADWGPGLALLAASLLFGVAHCLTWTYLGLAFLAGVYFGSLYWWTDCLWTPIVTHAAYDFFALVYLLRSPKRKGGPG